MNPTDETILGIDFGSKRIGVALSRSGSTMAFPEGVITNDRLAMSKICELVTDNNVGVVVIGESLNLDGSDNQVMALIKAFKLDLENNNPDIDIYLEPEHYSSAQAERWQGNSKSLDASAAAVILQAWIDRMNFTSRQSFD